MSKDPSKHELKDTKANLNRTSYNQSQIKHMSVPIGKLVPCYMNMLKSGESINMDAQFNFRFPPTILPCQTPLKASIDFFAMPIKAVFDDYDLFCNQGMNHTANAPVLPFAYIKGHDDEETKVLCERQFGVNSLDDYLECPTYQSQSSDVAIHCNFSNTLLREGFANVSCSNNAHNKSRVLDGSVYNTRVHFVKNHILFSKDAVGSTLDAQRKDLYDSVLSPRAIVQMNQEIHADEVLDYDVTTGSPKSIKKSCAVGGMFYKGIPSYPDYGILSSSHTFSRRLFRAKGGSFAVDMATGDAGEKSLVVLFGLKNVEGSWYRFPLATAHYTTLNSYFEVHAKATLPDIDIQFSTDEEVSEFNSVIHKGDFEKYGLGFYVIYVPMSGLRLGFSVADEYTDYSRVTSYSVSESVVTSQPTRSSCYPLIMGDVFVKAGGVPSSEVYFRTYGIPANGTQPRIKKNVLFERTYFGIYNFNYRDVDRDPLMEDANGEYTTDYNNGRRVINRCLPKKMRTEGADRHIYVLQNALLEKDVFTSAMPENLVNITTFVGMKPAPTGTATEEGPYVGLMAKDGVPCALRFQVSGDTWSVSDNPQKLTSGELAEAVRIAQSCISTHDLNDAGCLKRWLSNRIQKGYNSSEQQEAITGANSRYNPLTTPTYIGSSTQMVNSIQQTEQSGENCGEPYGLLTLQGGSMNTIRHYATDDCIIMGILRVTPLPLYAETINPLHLITLYDHFYQPEFDTKPWEPIRYAEMCPLQSAGGHDDYSNEIFGWQVPWHAYKFSHDTVTGRFREIAESSLIMRDLPAKPMLGKAFIECDPNDYTFPFEETSYHEMVGFISFDVTTERLASNTQTRVI